MDMELVAEGLLFPEGPVAMADGTVLVTEIARGTISRVHPNGRVEVECETGGGPNGAAIGPDGALYITNNGGSLAWTVHNGKRFPATDNFGRAGAGRVQRYDFKSGKVTDLYVECDGRSFQAPNDLVFDKQGNFWFTDHGAATPDGRAFGGLYYASPDGSSITRLKDRMISPNGVGLSPDERVLYMADTELARLWAFDLEEPGRVRKHPHPSPNGGRLICGLPGYQRFDSMAVDAYGNICVATLASGCVTVVSPEGQVLRQVMFPDPMVTNICFGGPDMKTAYITLSGTGQLVSMDWPEPGLPLAYS